jgi:hypothetical protein
VSTGQRSPKPAAQIVRREADNSNQAAQIGGAHNKTRSVIESAESAKTARQV